MLNTIYQCAFGACVLVTRATKASVTSKMFRSELKSRPAAPGERLKQFSERALACQKADAKVVNDKSKNLSKRVVPLARARVMIDGSLAATVASEQS